MSSLPQELQQLFRYLYKIFFCHMWKGDWTFFFLIYYSHIDANQRRYIDTLKDAVAIKSISAFPEYRDEIFRMINWTSDKLKALGTTIELADVGNQVLHDGRTIKLPDVILGTLGKVCHILLIFDW